MGQPNPYTPGSSFFNENVFDGDIEEDTDDDLDVDEMPADMLIKMAQEMISQIADGSYSMECALINLRQVKYGYNKEHDQIIEGIYPAFLEYLAGKIKDAKG